MKFTYKLLLLSGLFFLLHYSGFSQIQIKSTQLEPLSQKDQELLLSYPSLELPESYKNKAIPYMVDHSQSEHFRDMFVQSGMSCGQASSTGICFTYEMNAARDLTADNNANLYPTHFVFNWDNGDWGGNGVSYYHTLEVLRTVGTPNQEEYGGTIDFGGNYRWCTGYDLYYNAMKNRIRHAYKIEVGDAIGMQTLKNWMIDHLNGDEEGGCAIFYSTVPYPDGTLPTDTEEAGKKVITNLSASTSHSMAILGFNDSIRYDYNGDGLYTNDIDITGDGQVTMADWEIGGIKMCNTYSGGPAWADGGFCYIMYKAIATGAFWHDVVHVMTVNPNYEPQLTAKASITYTNRKRIKVIAGISTNISSTMPEYVVDLPIFDYQGGDRYMTGGEEESDKTLEFGLDLTPLLNYIEPNQEAKYFIQIYENDADGWGSGTLNSFSLINYSSGSPVESTCSSTAQSIPQNGIASMSIISSENFDPVEITSTALSSGAISSPFSQQMTATGGSQPYTWSFDMDFEISETTGSFPTGGTTLSGTGFLTVPLGFSFDYYGEEINTIYIKNNGLVVFQSGFYENFPYNNDHEATIFMHTKCIAPFYDLAVTSTMSSISGSDYKTIIWDNSEIDFAMTIYENGLIEFIYDNTAISNQYNYVCGVSNGDEVNFQRLSFDDPNNITNGHKYKLVPFKKPDEFEITDNGLLTGLPTHEYLAEEFHIRVTDNNGIKDKIHLPFVTDGLILSTSISTPNNNIIEYAETATIDMTVSNPLAIAVTGISISASTNDSNITITDGIESCTDLNPTDEELLSGAFTFDISSNVPDNYQFQISYTVTSDQDIWEYEYTYTAYAPNIELGTIIIDDSNDNILAPDETADISIPILNNGSSGLHNIVVTATSNDPYITLNTTTDNIIGLEPTQSENASLNITVASNVPNQHDALVNITITADNGYETNLEVYITINTAILSISSLSVDDGDDGCLNPGETSDVILNLENIGLVPANNITATLSTTDPMVIINSAPQNIPLLNAGSWTPLTYNISIDPSCDMAHLVEFNLNTTADNGLNINTTCYLIIGILIENFESGGLSTFEWSESDDSPWYIVTNEVYEGAYSLKSGEIDNNETSVLEIDMYVVADGEISFVRKVSSENNYDFFEFLIDGVVKTSLSGEQAWGEYSCPVTVGTHTFTWRYRKDYSNAIGIDAAWIDNIVFPAVNNIPPILSCQVSDISKLMNTNQEEIDPLTISNIGGGVVEFELDIIPTNPETKSIEGSTLEVDISSFEPGLTYDVTFTLNAQSDDMEWIKTLSVDFPDEVTVNSSTDLVGSSGTLFSNGITGSSTNVIWTTTETFGQIHEGETATCSVNLTFGSDYIASTSIFDCIIIGDGYGSNPHEINYEIEIVNENFFWLSVSPSHDVIPYDSDFELSLSYNTADMEEGVYNANLVISDPYTSLTIPVMLTVDFTSGNEISFIETEYNVYPNPFIDEVYLDYYFKTNDIISVYLLDITGKLIDIPLNNEKVLSGKTTFNISSNTSIPTGMYILRIETSQDCKFVKIIKD